VCRRLLPNGSRLAGYPLALDLSTVLEVLHRLDKADLLEMLEGARKSPLEIPPEPFRNLCFAGPLKRLHDP